MTRAFLILSLCLASRTTTAADDPIFSGPQPGEKTPSFIMHGVVGDDAQQEIKPVDRADGKPLLLVFVHKRTRPGFALTNAAMRFAASRSKDGLNAAVCFLTDDPTATEAWMKRIPKYFAKGVPHGISHDGAEGPGAYGLNSNVTLTVLVARDNRVTGNFALVQPSVQADGPKILKAVVDVLGGGKVPDIAQFSNQRYGDQARKRMRAGNRPNGASPELQSLLRAVIQKDASDDDVDKAAAAVEEHLKKHAPDRNQVGTITKRIIDAGKLENYGTPHAQKILTRWSKEYAQKQRKADEAKPDEVRQPDKKSGT